MNLNIRTATTTTTTTSTTMTTTSATTTSVRTFMGNVLWCNFTDFRLYLENKTFRIRQKIQKNLRPQTTINLISNDKKIPLFSSQGTVYNDVTSARRKNKKCVQTAHQMSTDSYLLHSNTSSVSSKKSPNVDKVAQK